MSDSLENLIKQEAKRQGFALSGVTVPRQPLHWRTYENWLASGRHAEMSYLAEQRSRTCRSDPRHILAECRSILVLGIRYPEPLSPASSEAGKPTGRIAAYAWGRDYHRVLPERLHALANFIQEKAGRTCLYRAFTDTGPILERDLAQQAGLGWIGKNTCLISPDMGSYFLLAELLLDIELDPDSPFEADHCGKCARCIQACPTGCILPDRTIDARRCIAYLTIEEKGSIPVNLRPRLGSWIFGCDICQQVCPWNRFTTPEVDIAFAPRPEITRPDLIAELQELTPEAFARKYKESPVKRAKRGGYLRNVVVALGNAHDPGAIPALQAAISDADALVREHACWALESLSGDRK